MLVQTSALALVLILLLLNIAADPQSLRNARQREARFTMSIQRHLLGLFLLGASACASSASTSAGLTRSPTLDYPPPAQETSDGQSVGVDTIRPEHKLRASPQLGIGGLTPAERPSRVEHVDIDPLATPVDPVCTVLGLDEAVRKARCPKYAEVMQTH